MGLDRNEGRMREAIRAWVLAMEAGSGKVAACRAAAEKLVGQPWDMVVLAGRLARAEPRKARRELGLTAGLVTVGVYSSRAVYTVAGGSFYPSLDRAGKKRSGAFDTPRQMASEAVDLALAAARGRVRSGLDPSCGSGAFLLAMLEKGVPRLHGIDNDPSVLAVASVLLPGAKLEKGDFLSLPKGRRKEISRPAGSDLAATEVDLLVGNPPYVSPERQDSRYRASLRERIPWLHGRFDLAVPFVWTAMERLRDGGGACLVLPQPLLVQPYGLELRRRLLQRHLLTHIGEARPFPGAAVLVSLLALCKNRGPGPVGQGGISATDLLAIPSLPITPFHRPGDLEILELVRGRSFPLGQICLVDTGVVCHGPGHRRAHLLHEKPAEGRFEYADARDMSLGRRWWLDYKPEIMHRPKSLSLFSPPKLLVARIAGRKPLRVWLDRSRLVPGHTLNVLKLGPATLAPPLARIRDLLESPLTRGLLLLAKGDRLDVYPGDLRQLPVPLTWKSRPDTPLDRAWGLEERHVVRLTHLARRVGHGEPGEPGEV